MSSIIARIRGPTLGRYLRFIRDLIGYVQNGNDIQASDTVDVPVRSQIDATTQYHFIGIFRDRLQWHSCAFLLLHGCTSDIRNQNEIPRALKIWTKSALSSFPDMIMKAMQNIEEFHLNDVLPLRIPLSDCLTSSDLSLPIRSVTCSCIIKGSEFNLSMLSGLTAVIADDCRSKLEELTTPCFRHIMELFILTDRRVSSLTCRRLAEVIHSHIIFPSASIDSDLCLSDCIIK